MVAAIRVWALRHRSALRLHDAKAAAPELGLLESRTPHKESLDSLRLLVLAKMSLVQSRIAPFEAALFRSGGDHVTKTEITLPIKVGLCSGIISESPPKTVSPAARNERLVPDQVKIFLWTK